MGDSGFEKEKKVNTLFVPAVILFLIQHPKVGLTNFSSLKTEYYLNSLKNFT